MITREKNGQTFEFDLLLIKILEMEAENPNYSFIEDMQSMGEKPRLLTIDRVMDLAGHPLVELVNAGFSMDEVGDLFAELISKVGFFKTPDIEE